MPTYQATSDALCKICFSLQQYSTGTLRSRKPMRRLPRRAASQPLSQCLVEPNEMLQL